MYHHTKDESNRWWGLKNFNIVDADVNANADAEGSTIALRERCSGELKMSISRVLN